MIMRKLLLILAVILLTINCSALNAEASLISTGSYRHEQNKINRYEEKQIKQLFKQHTDFANEHNTDALKTLYSDSYINSDGFGKDTYFKSIEQTWNECKDLTYKVKIISIDVSGNNASVSVEETAVGTIYDVADTYSVAGEIHAKSASIYLLTKLGDKWLISGENMLSDESSLLYGDARFMNIELITPNQVASGELYTATVKVDADENTVIVGSLEHDPVIYPSKVPEGPLRTMPKTNVLERYIKANTDNINEYAVASLAISKTETTAEESTKIYMAGIACIMKRVNVIPKNNFINSEDKE